MPDPDDELCAQIREFYLSLTTEWRTLPTRNLQRSERLGLFLLAGAALIELSFTGQAWTDDSSVDFEATATGAWMDFDRTSMLPEAVRRVVPSWKGRRVIAQIGEELRVRLSRFGQQNLEDVRNGSDFGPMPGSLKRIVLGAIFFEFMARHRIVGKVGVRILGTRPTQPGVVKEDSTSFNETLLAMLRDMSQTQQSMAHSLNTLVSMGASLSASYQTPSPASGTSGIRSCVMLAHQS